MFESNEAVMGCLIGPKPWDRIDIILWNPNVQPITVGGCLGVLFYKICDKSCIGLDEAGNGRELRVH